MVTVLPMNRFLVQIHDGSQFLNGDVLHASVFNWREPLTVLAERGGHAGAPYGYVVVDCYGRRGIAT